MTTTEPGRLRHDSEPMRLYHEAKRAGGWDPRAIDLRRDAADWARLRVVERDLLLRLTALFQMAEERMLHDLAALLVAVVREGQLEDELFLTTFLADEARHTEFFRRVLDEVCGQSGDLERYRSPSFRRLFAEKLPASMGAVLADPSPEAQAEALVTYTLVGEGVLGEAGYQVYSTALASLCDGVMPGFRDGLRRAQADEDRHMAYGVHRLSRLVAGDDAVWKVVSETMDRLIPDTLGIVTEFFDAYDPLPFGLSLQATTQFAMERFASRWASLEEARERERSAQARARRDEPIAQLLAWARAAADPVPVEVREDQGGASFRFQTGSDASVLRITRDVLAHHTGREIMAALEADRAALRLLERGGVRLTCLRAAGTLVVQSP